MKKHDKTKSVATSSIIDIPEVSYNFNIESNSNISLRSMSSAIKNNDKHSKLCETQTLASNSSNINQNILYDIDQSSPAPSEQIPSSGAYMLSAMNTLLNMNEQNVNDYQSGSPNYSENINTVPISQFSTPRPILSASGILRNGANNFYVNIDTDQTYILQLIYEQGIETNAYLKRLDGRMDRLEQTIKNMSGSQNNNNYAIDNAFLSIFPLKDFDIRITNEPDFKFNVITFISRIGGTDVKNVIKRVLQRIISNELSSKCSWTGFRNNFRLQNILKPFHAMSNRNFKRCLEADKKTANLNFNNKSSLLNQTINCEYFDDKLRQLICDYHISHNCVNKLLEILKSEGLDLPKDVRILFQIPKNYSIINVHPGTYIHIDIQLGVHIDGLPISSSKSNLWPILISIVNILILSKYVMPTLMTEMKSIISNGLCLNGKIYNFVISQLICDAPAKAFMLNVKSFNAYHSCNYCIEEGTFINDRMSFLGVSSPLRTDDSFRSKEDEDYHKGSSPLEDFPINIVLTVVLDYMHCVCLGVMKRLLTFWVKAKKPIRFKSPEIVSDISSQLIDIMKPYFPSEFNRLPRSLEELEFFKATEFRTFLLYTSLIVLKERLAKPFFQDFMLFHCAIKILISNDLYITHNTIAKNLLISFVSQYPTIYGYEYVTYNVHGLIHLADFALQHGPLDKFSA
ncbi:hypothetical protein QTP88_006437 [Uroleucon formosanum]